MIEDELRSRLIEDTGSPEEAGRLLPVIRRLDAWRAPQPDAQETARLAAKLEKAGEVSALVFGRRLRALEQRPIPKFWCLLRSQLRVLHREMWAASALVMLLGTLVALADYRRSSVGGTALPFILIAPIVSAIGVAYLYGPAADPALEIELALPVTASALLLSRLVLVFGFNLVLGLLASFVLSVAHSDLSFWPLVSAWLAPMTFLSMLAFLLAMLTRDPGVGMLVSLGIWTVQSIKELSLRSLPWPDLNAAGTHLWLWSLAALMGIFALWVGRREEHWLKA